MATFPRGNAPRETGNGKLLLYSSMRIPLETSFPEGNASQRAGNGPFPVFSALFPLGKGSLFLGNVTEGA